MHKSAITIHERTSWSYFQSSHPNRTENGLQAAPDPKGPRTRISLQWLIVAAHWPFGYVTLIYPLHPSPTHLGVICALRILVFFQILEQLGVTTLRLGTWRSKPGQTIQWLYWINWFCLKNYLTWMPLDAKLEKRRQLSLICKCSRLLSAVLARRFYDD